MFLYLLLGTISTEISTPCGFRTKDKTRNYESEKYGENTITRKEMLSISHIICLRIDEDCACGVDSCRKVSAV